MVLYTYIGKYVRLDGHWLGLSQGVLMVANVEVACIADKGVSKMYQQVYIWGLMFGRMSKIFQKEIC